MQKKYTDLLPAEVDYILVKTTSAGPYVEDVFYLIFSKATDSYWEIPQSSDNDFINWLKTFSDVNMDQLIKSMGSTDDRIFILYRGPNYPVLSEKQREYLKNRLNAFLKSNFEASTETLSEIADKILASYNESSRHYHNLEHIQNCLWELDQLTDTGIDKVSIELAIWYHDLIYSPLSKNNELVSAKKMKEDLGSFTTKLTLDKIYQMILCSPDTLKMRDLSESEKYFLDIDYSILGYGTIEYMAYIQNVRQEYRKVPSLIYYLKRKSFLKSNLKREIYQTIWFKNRYAEQALRNIKAELSKMPYKILPTLR